ncbi:MAG: CvpA family protein [Pseudohongiellaceae bacterium]
MDIAILSIVAVSFLFGLWRGLVKEVLSLLTWIAALLVARIYSEPLAPTLSGLLEGETTRYVAAFAILFIVTMMLGTLLNHFIGKLLTITGLKFTDRLLGGVFGIARGVIIVLLVMFFTGTFVSETGPWQQSQLIPQGLALIEWSRIFIGDFSGLDFSAGGMPTGNLN